MRTARLRITGRVQGVGYRAWAARAAPDLGLRGWVRNRSDGSVEALVTGADQAVATMLELSRSGPRGAQVVDVAIVPDEDETSFGFVVRPTV